MKEKLKIVALDSFDYPFVRDAAGQPIPNQKDSRKICIFEYTKAPVHVPCMVMHVLEWGDARAKITVDLGVLILEKEEHYHALAEDKYPFGYAGVTLAKRKFSKTLGLSNLKEVNARLKYWLDGGRINASGMVADLSSPLPFMLLARYPNWRDDGRPCWKDRLREIEQALREQGNKMTVNVQMIKQLYHRMFVEPHKLL